MNDLKTKRSENIEIKNYTYTKNSQRILKDSDFTAFNKIDIKKEKNDTNPKISSKKKIIIIITILFSSLLIITGLVLIIGHLCFSWFKNKEPLIINKIREENLVSRYSEAKKAINYYNSEGVNEEQTVQNNSLYTDFIVGLNKINRLDKRYDFNNIDFLY